MLELHAEANVWEWSTTVTESFPILWAGETERESKTDNYIPLFANRNGLTRYGCFLVCRACLDLAGRAQRTEEMHQRHDLTNCTGSSCLWPARIATNWNVVQLWTWAGFARAVARHELFSW